MTDVQKPELSWKNMSGRGRYCFCLVWFFIYLFIYFYICILSVCTLVYMQVCFHHLKMYFYFSHKDRLMLTGAAGTQRALFKEQIRINNPAGRQREAERAGCSDGGYRIDKRD